MLRTMLSGKAAPQRMGRQGSGDALRPLAASRTANDPTGENLLQILLNGQKVETAHGTLSIPSFLSAYTGAQLAAVVNYVIRHFDGKTGQVTAEDVARRRSTN